MPIEKWYIEKIRDKTRLRYAAEGGYLDDTMTRGEGGAGLIKFPVAGGVINMYELSGAVQDVDISEINFDMVELKVRDFEATALTRAQDNRKTGPAQEDALSKLMSRTVRVKRDTLKFDALNNFANVGATALTDQPTAVETIGDGSARLDLETAVYITSRLHASGAEDEMFFPMPYSCFDQLMLYKQFSNCDYQGPSDLFFAKSSKVKKKTFQGVHFMALPDSVFTYGSGAYGTGATQTNGYKISFDENGYLDLFAWAKDAMGSEIEWDQENMQAYEQPQLKGTPNLWKVQLSGNSVGLLPEGVKRVRVKAINKAINPA
jgi:hypothetical protein